MSHPPLRPASTMKRNREELILSKEQIISVANILGFVDFGDDVAFRLPPTVDQHKSYWTATPLKYSNKYVFVSCRDDLVKKRGQRDTTSDTYSAMIERAKLGRLVFGIAGFCRIMTTHDAIVNLKTMTVIRRALCPTVWKGGNSISDISLPHLTSTSVFPLQRSFDDPANYRYDDSLLSSSEDERITLHPLLEGPIIYVSQDNNHDDDDKNPRRRAFFSTRKKMNLTNVRWGPGEMLSKKFSDLWFEAGGPPCADDFFLPQNETSSFTYAFKLVHPLLANVSRVPTSCKTGYIVYLGSVCNQTGKVVTTLPHHFSGVNIVDPNVGPVSPYLLRASPAATSENDEIEQASAFLDAEQTAVELFHKPDYAPFPYVSPTEEELSGRRIFIMPSFTHEEADEYLKNGFYNGARGAVGCVHGPVLYGCDFLDNHCSMSEPVIVCASSKTGETLHTSVIVPEEYAFRSLISGNDPNTMRITANLYTVALAAAAANSGEDTNPLTPAEAMYASFDSSFIESGLRWHHLFREVDEYLPTFAYAFADQQFVLYAMSQYVERCQQQYRGDISDYLKSLDNDVVLYHDLKSMGQQHMRGSSTLQKHQKIDIKFGYLCVMLILASTSSLRKKDVSISFNRIMCLRSSQIALCVRALLRNHVFSDSSCTRFHIVRITNELRKQLNTKNSRQRGAKSSSHFSWTDSDHFALEKIVFLCLKVSFEKTRNNKIKSSLLRYKINELSGDALFKINSFFSKYYSKIFEKREPIK
jgi:hypothetical protein